MTLRESFQKTLRVSLNWKGDVCSEVKMRHHTILLDSGMDEGGGDQGPTPTEIFLASLGSCIMTNIFRIGQKMKLGLRDVRMEITGVKEHNDHPSSFVTLSIDVLIKAKSQDPEKLRKLVRLAEENCTISNTLRNAVKPSVRLQPI